MGTLLSQTFDVLLKNDEVSVKIVGDFCSKWAGLKNTALVVTSEIFDVMKLLLSSKPANDVVLFGTDDDCVVCITGILSFEIFSLLTTE